MSISKYANDNGTPVGKTGANKGVAKAYLAQKKVEAAAREAALADDSDKRRKNRGDK